MDYFTPNRKNTRKYAMSSKRVKIKDLTPLDKKRIYKLYAHRDRLNILEGNGNDDLQGNYWEVDHIHPIAQGGEHEPGNLRLLRKYANTSKMRTQVEVDELRDKNIKRFTDPNWPVVDWDCPRLIR